MDLTQQIIDQTITWIVMFAIVATFVYVSNMMK